MTKSVAIIGAGQAASQACASLRQFGFEGDISVFGEELDLPYQRPPLSKAYMKSELERERLFFKSADWYASNGIDLRLGDRVSKVERTSTGFSIYSGTQSHSDIVIFATGSRPRPLPVPGAQKNGVFDLRTLADVDAIKEVSAKTNKWVIIGGGYIGLEAAAVARQMGKDVTVLEMEDRVLSRVTSSKVSDYYTSLHSGHGVSIITGRRVTELLGEQSVSAVCLDNDEELPADLVLSGIGIVPNFELAEDLGVACNNGIIVDESGRTNIANVFAAGDCCCRPLVHYGRTGRLESVHNAIEQAKIIAATITEQAPPAEECPWFWSDQYDVKLQIAGLSAGFDQQIIREDPGSGKLAVFYFLEGRLIAVDALNSPPEYIVAKQLIQMGAPVDAETIANTDLSMKEILKRYK